jgi:hypothetical protein
VPCRAVLCRAVPCGAVRCGAWHGMARHGSMASAVVDTCTSLSGSAASDSTSLRIQPFCTPACSAFPPGRQSAVQQTHGTYAPPQTERRRQRRCRADPSSAATPRVPIRTEGWRPPAEHGIRIHARALCRLMITPSELIEHPIEPTLASSRTGISGVENASSTTRRCATG